MPFYFLFAVTVDPRDWVEYAGIGEKGNYYNKL